MSYAVLECDVVMFQNYMLDFEIKEIVINRGRYLCQILYIGDSP